MAAFDYDRVRADLAGRETRDWPEARLRVLVDLHQEEKSFTDIARRIGGGATKNSCIAKASRLGLPLRDRNACYRKYAAAHRPKAEKPKPKAAPRAPRPAAPIRNPQKLAALALPGLHHGLISALSAHQCRWPIGDPKAPDFSLCGRLRREGETYCPSHRHAAYTPAKTEAKDYIRSTLRFA